MSEKAQPVTGSTGSVSDQQKEVPVRSNTPENSKGKLNPSAPEDSNVTPGSAATAVSLFHI